MSMRNLENSARSRRWMSWIGGSLGRRSSSLDRAKPRSFRPANDSLPILEDRIAPAVIGRLSVVGNILTYSGVGNNYNNVTITGTDTTTITITENNGEIENRTGQAGISVVGGVATISPVPGFIRGIAIDGNQGFDQINAGALTLTNRSLTLSSELVNITGNLLTDAGGVGGLGGAIIINGNVSLAPVGATTILIDTDVPAPGADGNITINGSLSVGSPSLTTLQIFGGQTGNVTINGLTNLPGATTVFGVTGNNVRMGQTIVSPGTGTGNFDVNAYNSLTFTGQVVTGTGLAQFQANTDGIGAESFTTASNILTGGGDVNVSAGGRGSISLRLIDANPAGAVAPQPTVSLIAGGSIIDSNGTLPNVRGTSLTVTAGLLGVGGGTVSLDTQVATINQVITNGIGGTVNLRNTGALVVDGPISTANGSIDLRNQGNLTVNSLTGSIVAGGQGKQATITTTNGGNILLDNSVQGFGLVRADQGRVNITSGGSISDTTAFQPVTPNPAIASPFVTLFAATGILTGGNDGLNTDTNNLSARVTTGGIVVFDFYELAPAPTDPQETITVTAANANAGNVDIQTQKDLAIKGNVTTSSGSVTLVAHPQPGAPPFEPEGRFDQLSGVIAATTTVTITSSNILTSSAGSVIVAGTNVTISGSSPSNQTVIMSLAGNVSAGGSIAVNGGQDFFEPNIVEVSGNFAAGTSIAILNNARTNPGADILSISGNLAAGTTVNLGAVTATGLTLSLGGKVTGGTGVTVNGSNSGDTIVVQGGSSELVAATGDVVINASATATGNAVYSLAGKVVANGGNVTITGTSLLGTGSNSIVISGLVSASALVNVGAVSTGNVNIVIPGTLTSGTGTTVGTTTTSGPVSITISGVITSAVAVPPIAINGGTSTDTITVTGSLTGATTINGLAGANLYYLKPQAGATIVVIGGAGVDTIQILTSLLNIVTANLVSATFTTASGFQSWGPNTMIDTIIPFV